VKIAVLGASGGTGRAVVENGRARGHEMIPVVRRAGSGGDGERVADGRDPVALRAALTGVDAVISTIGPGTTPGDSTAIHDSAVATLEALPLGCRYIVVTASGPVVDGDDPLTRFVAKPILRRVFRDVWADFTATEAVVTPSSAAATIARPPMLLDGPARGRYRSRRDGNVRWGFSIRRADLAAALLDMAEDDTTIGRVISVAS
jgi:putative NADH-flavin reductase